MFKFICHFFLLTIIAFGLTSCNDSEKSSQQKVTLLLDWLPNPNHVPLYVGVEEGIFQKHGIDLEILKLYDCNDTLAYLNGEQADLAIYYMPHTLQALERGMELKVIGTLVPQSLDGFLVKESSEVKSTDDLENLVLGNYLSLLDRKMLQHLSHEKGIKFKDVKQIYFDPAAALKSDIVEAVSGICWNIEQSQLRGEGIETTCFKFEDLNIPKYEELVFLSNINFSKQYPDKIHKFQAALKEAIEYSQANSDESFASYALANQDKSDKTLEWEKQAWECTYPLYSSSTKPNQTVWKEFYQWMKDKGILEGGHDVDFEELFL